MSERKLKRLNPRELSPEEQLSVAILREIIVWVRDNPGGLTEFDPVRQYESYLFPFQELAIRELKGVMSEDPKVALEQLNMSAKRSTWLLEWAGIGYPLSITEPLPRYINA